MGRPTATEASSLTVDRPPARLGKTLEYLKPRACIHKAGYRVHPGGKPANLMQVNTTMSAVVYVGVDVSLDTLDLSWKDVGPDPAYLGKFANTPIGRRKLLNRMKKLGSMVHVCLEPTSCYHLPLANLLHEAPGVTVSLVNPRAVKDFGRSLMRRAKTDPGDAGLLALYGSANQPRPWQPPRPQVLELRSISRRIEDVTQRRSAMYCRLHSARKAGAGQAVIADIKQELTQIKQRLAKLEQAALKVIHADELLNRRYKLIKTMPGIAQTLGIRILAEVSVLPDDLGKRQWVAMAGLDPVAQESGKLAALRRISKQGNPRVRKALFIAALVATQKNTVIREYYEQLQARTRCAKMQALCAVMRKQLQCIWGILQSDTPYQHELFCSR